jgi:uncharacterized protein YggE
MRRTCLLLGLVLLTFTCPVLADDDSPRTITTSGEAIIYVQPDEVIFNFGIDVRGSDLSKAASVNEEIAGKLIVAVKKLGIEEKHIQTDQLQIGVVYRNHDDLTIDGYNVQRSYCVRLKDPKKFQALVETVLKNGANRVGGFEFRTTELRKHRDKARALAIVAAKEKAGALAGELNCVVGSPRTINETSGGHWYGGGLNFGNVSQNMAQSSPSSGESPDSDQLPLGQITVRANVTVTFDLLVPMAKPISGN